MKTFHAKPGDIKRSWHVLNMENKVLGRAATEIAKILRGKNKPQYSPHMDTGDFVVVVNAAKVKLTGKKMAKKQYHWHTGFPGGLKTIEAQDLVAKKPELVVKKAVQGMLPKNPLGRKMLKKLKIYGDDNHPHEAQNPQELKL